MNREIYIAYNERRNPMTTSIVVSGKSLLIVGVAINVVAVSVINSRFERRVKSARKAEEFVRNQYNRLVVKHIELIDEFCDDPDDLDAYQEDLRLQGDFANIVLENL